MSPSVASMLFLHFIYLFKQQYTHIFFWTSLLVQKQKSKEENHVPNKTCPTLHVWWCFLLDTRRCSWPQCSINACAMAFESPYRLSLVLLRCLLSGVGLYLISLSIFSWIHWGIGRFFCFLARNHLILGVSRREVQEQSQPHTPWWPRKEENPSPILNSCEFRNIRKFAGTLWKDKNILWVIGGSEQRRTLKAFPVTFSLNFKVQALGHLLLLSKGALTSSFERIRFCFTGFQITMVLKKEKNNFL